MSYQQQKSFIADLAAEAAHAILPQSRQIAQTLLNACHRVRHKADMKRHFTGAMVGAASEHAAEVARQDGLGAIVPIETAFPPSAAESFVGSWLHEINLIFSNAERDALLAIERAIDRQHGAFARQMARDLARYKVQRDHIRFNGQPLDRADYLYSDLQETHDSGWPRFLHPSPEDLNACVGPDILFGAFDCTAGKKLIAVVHLRVVPPGSTLEAQKLLGKQSRSFSITSYRPPQVRRDTLVAHAAVTNQKYFGAAITRRLITDVVLPYVATDPFLRNMPMVTSSPFTYFPTAAKALAQSPQFDELVARLNDALLRVTGEPLAKLVRSAAPHLWMSGFEVDTSCAEPAAFLRTFYNDLDEHKDLIKLADASTFAAYAALQKRHQRIIRVFGTPPQAAGSDAVLRRDAAVAFIRIAATITQSGIWTTEKGGESPDDINAFHLGNGASFAACGPILDSRPDDIAAFGMGQVFLYEHDAWRPNRERYMGQVAERRARARTMAAGTYIDMDVATAHIQRVVPALVSAA